MSDIVPIRCHSFVNDKSVHYFCYMVENYQSLAVKPEHLQFRAYLLSSGIRNQVADIVGQENISEVWKQPRFISRTIWKDWVRTVAAALSVELSMAGSNGHATGLNAACAATDPDVIDILADADTVLLRHSWDDWLREMMTRYGMVGTTYEDIGGFSSGNGPVQTYKAIPNLTWLAVGTGIEFSDFRCDAAKKIHLDINSPELAALYNLPEGYQLVRDVGWKLPAFLRDNGIAAAPLAQKKPTSPEAIAVKSGNDYNEEYQWAGEPVLAHQRGSHIHPFRDSEISIAFYDAVEAWLAKNNSTD